MTKTISLVLLLFLLGCSTPVVVTVVVTPEPPATNTDFIYAAYDCNSSLLAAADTPESGLCGAWKAEALLSLDRLERCWAKVPNPPDPYLKQSNADVKQYITFKRESLAELTRYCNGNGSLEVSGQYLSRATDALTSAIDNLSKATP